MYIFFDFSRETQIHYHLSIAVIITTVKGRLRQAWVHHAIPTDSVPTDIIPTIHSRDVHVGWLTAVE